MNVETQRDKIKSVVERWRRQYGSGGYGDDKLEILKRLESLDLETCSASDVDQIIGNSSWTRLAPCHECGAEGVQTVMLGQEPDYESYTAWVCKECLKKAIALIESVE